MLPISDQSAVLSMVKTHCNELDGICDGIFALGELSDRTLDRLMSFGELLASRLLAACLKAQGISHIWHDSRQLLRTDSRHGLAAVDRDLTDKQIQDFVAAQPSAIYVVPGFIASRCSRRDNHAGPRRLRLHGRHFCGGAGSGASWKSGRT